MISRKFTIEHKQKLSLAKKGKKQPVELVEKRASKLRGRKYSEEHKKNISDSLKGKKRPYMSKLIKDRKPDWTGKKHAEESLRKMRESHLGQKAWNKGKKNNKPPEEHWNWKGGITPINESIRRSLEYRLWRESVFTRDKYKCVWCKKKGVKLHADHIKPFAYFPELRFAIDNGRTLCEECHRNTDTYGGRAFNHKEK